MKVTISIAQIDVIAGRPEQNLRKGESFIAEAARRKSDVVCFPEMWTTGFDWGAIRSLEKEHEAVVERLGGLARKYSIWVGGSVLSLDRNGNPGNDFLLFNSDGKRAGIYRKLHLFRPIREGRHLAAGARLTVVDAPWGKSGLAICYDLRFPELFRSYALKGVKVVFLAAAFPRPRHEHWKILIRARAIENQMFMVAVNRVGSAIIPPAGAVEYFGGSAVIDPWGNTVVEAGGGETLLTATIDVSQVDRVRKKMRVLRDRRPDAYEL